MKYEIRPIFLERLLDFIVISYVVSSVLLILFFNK